MGKVDIPYYVVRKGRYGYWLPTKRMKAMGFRNVRCGLDGPEAWRIATEWNERWQRARRGLETGPIAAVDGKVGKEQAEDALIWPVGSLGEAFRRYRRTAEWRKKKPRTREDWWRGWKYIKPIFGDLRPSLVDLEGVSAWREELEAAKGTREAHRAMKIWRALWQVAAALKYCHPDLDPSFAVANSAARARSRVWSEGEVVRLVKHAWRAGYRGLAAAMAVMWDGHMSPVDARTLTAGQRVVTAHNDCFFGHRGKTGEPICALLSPRTKRLLDGYIAWRGVELHPEAPLFLTREGATTSRGGRPWPARPFTKDNFGDEFRVVRMEVFGPLENRQLADFRRSGALEAIAGDATREKLGHAMGNSIAASDELFRTYVPVNTVSLADVQEARRKGRQKMRDGNENR